MSQRPNSGTSAPSAGTEAEPAGGDVDSSGEQGGVGAPPDGRKVRGRVTHGVEGAKQRYEGSSAEHVWRRLDAMDFINRGMLFAAILLLCFFPFIIVVNALAGRSTVTGLVRHLGLNHQAAAIVSGLFTSTQNTSKSLSGASYVLFILGGVAAASAIQDLYERSFGLEARGMRDILRRLAWLGVLIVGAVLGGWAGSSVRNSVGPVLFAIVALVLLAAFWWFTMWFLLGGRVHWRAIVPSAIATALFWVGMELVFHLTFSNTIISNNKKYGPIGVVFALMSWLIAIGVVIILGAIVGVVWRERGLSFGAAFRRLRHRTDTTGTPAAPQPGAAAPGSGDDASGPQVG